MIVMGVNLSHDGSVCVIEDGSVVFYQEEERITHKKHTTGFINSFSKAMDLYDPEEIIFVGAFPYEFLAKDFFASLMMATGRYKHFTNNKKYNVHWMRDHHLAHAEVAFVNSKFSDAGVLVIDGAGQAFVSNNGLHRESETMLYASNGRHKEIRTLHKNLITQMSEHEYGISSLELADMPYFRKCSQRLPTEYTVSIYNTDLSFGKMFSAVGKKIFGGYHNAGKVMGLSAYGNDLESHPRAWIDGVANKDILSSDISDEDLAYRVQTDSLSPSIDLIKKTVSLSNSKNICLTGGYFLNCVNNYKYLKDLPDVNFYVEPNSSDSGTAIGAAMWLYRKITNKFAKPTNNMYLGADADYSWRTDQGIKIVEASPLDVATIISNKNVVAIYQGKSESGPRALGNRSILYDPRDFSGRDIVNEIKKREYFRPFAGTVLQEEAASWFEMLSLRDSSSMMYAVQCKKDKADLVPALQHNDGTSRIQTISKEQNINYYKLIDEFYKITGVPMLLNTSFNLAGDTLVETMDDAIRTCKESGIKYLYLPEILSLVTF